MYSVSPTVFSVTELNNYVKRILDNDENLKNVFVTGEIEGDILDTLINVFIKVATVLIGFLGFDIEEGTLENLLGNLL